MAKSSRIPSLKASRRQSLNARGEIASKSDGQLQLQIDRLTAVNDHFRKALRRERATICELEGILFSTAVATVLLDKELRVRFSTPAAHQLFGMLPGYTGQPLSETSTLAVGGELFADVSMVLQTTLPIEREIRARSGTWLMRRVLPYRARGARVKGVVLTFVDITERHNISDALETARKDAQFASLAKSRFLAAASHDLRQPLQTIVLLQGILAKNAQGEKKQKLVARLGDAAGAMSSMLNALLDINLIEAGAVQPVLSTFVVNDLFARLKEEFSYNAQAQRLSFNVVPCSVSIKTDSRLFEQIVRNLLSNAMKYTRSGKVLLGCRRRHGCLRIEVWDTGIGIPESQFQSIFEEYNQLDNAARQRSRGLGLGLFIVQRLARLMNYRVAVQSRLGVGSCFSLEIAMSDNVLPVLTEPRNLQPREAPQSSDASAGTIMVIEDDPDVRENLDLFLQEMGYRVNVAPDGISALRLAAEGSVHPDLILADYNLPDGISGLDVIGKLREAFARAIPAIILTGDISTTILQAIERRDCEKFNKPVHLTDLTDAIRRLLKCSAPATRDGDLPYIETRSPARQTTIFVVDDDKSVRDSIRSVLEDARHTVEDFATCEAFLAAYRREGDGCLLVDAHLPGMSGLELLQRLKEAESRLPAIMITGNGDVPMAVKAMKSGVVDFIEKPVRRENIIASVERALEIAKGTEQAFVSREIAAKHIAELTSRQREIMALVLAGHPSKNIAADLGISQRTVENHRAAVMKRTGAKSLPELARLALNAGGN